MYSLSFTDKKGGTNDTAGIFHSFYSILGADCILTIFVCELSHSKSLVLIAIEIEEKKFLVLFFPTLHFP